MKNVKIVVADIRLFAVDKNKILSRIAPCYVEKYHKYKIQRDADQELVSGYLLQKYLGIYQDKQLVYNEKGKPFLASGKKYFNISHSGDYVVLVIADCDVGIDIEKIRTYHEAIVKKVFNTKQKAELLTKEGDERNKSFTRIWTECEAILKLKGIGFAEEKDCEDGGDFAYAIHTTQIDDYILTCATQQQTSIYITFKMEETNYDTRRSSRKDD